MTTHSSDPDDIIYSPDTNSFVPYDRNAWDPHWHIVPSAVVSPRALFLYRQAFERFPTALWNKKNLSHPDAVHLLIVAQALRLSSLASRCHGEKLERAVRASD